MTALDYYLWGAVKDKRYVDKPEIVSANAPITNHCLVQPFFFENEQGVAVTVNGDNYRAMLNEFLFTETIDALKDNIREAIGQIQLHTIDNVLKNWTNRVGYCLASRGSHLNEIIFHY